jgi:DNA-binding winged helix-turn-helix (wHTH) protein/tetratricopeptide (TPR) repeat protein/TolB-like protein
VRSAPLYRIDDYSIDLAARAIRHGDAIVDVEAKVFDLVALLIEHRDRALSKREINDALWGQRPVTDAALSQLLSKARRALGDDGESQQVIRTVHGRGLQWVADARIDGAEEPAAAVVLAPTAMVHRAARPWWLAALAAALAIAAALLVPHVPPSAGDGPALPRVAILPVVDRTGDADLAWTRNGLMGLIASLLQERGRIEVIGSQLVQAQVGARETFDAPALATLGKSLGATHFVSGELRRVGSLYELELHLSVNGLDTHHDVLRGTAPTPLAVDSVVRLQRWLGIAAPAAVSDDTGIRSPFLIEAYARGLDASIHGDAVNAKKYFQICLDQDPTLLWPRLRLAIAQGATNEADASIENATRVATIARERGENDLLVPALRQLSASAYFKGDGDAAAKYLDEALLHLTDDSQPLTLAGVHSTYGAVEIKRGHVAQARRHLELALPLTRSTGNRRNEASVLANLAIVDGEQGRFDDRLTRFREAIDAARESGSIDLELRTLGGLAAAEYDAGHALSAVPMLTRALALAQAQSDLQTRVHVATNLARVLAIFGRYDDADALVKQALAIGETQANANWQAKAHWARGIIAEQRAAWNEASAALDEAHRLFAGGNSDLDDVAVLGDAARVATRSGDSATAERVSAALAQRIAANPDNAAMAAWQPLVAAQVQHTQGHRDEAVAALKRLVDAHVGHADWPPRFDALLQLGRWQLEQNDAVAALALAGALDPWLAQQPNVIAWHVAALRASGDGDAAAREQKRLDALNASPELRVEASLLAPPEPVAKTAQPAR